ncbi:MAG: hypothetical protein KTR25_12200 [Myxococcales bacterium]|nr:hypothetical protein [Myxococcales bacterium]
MSELKYEPGLNERANEDSNGKRVMILDGGMNVTSMLRLASRLIDIYHVDQDRNLIIPYSLGGPTGYFIPAPLKDFLTAELVQESPIPPAGLSQIVSINEVQMLEKVIQNYQLNDYFVNHGIGLVVKLRDLVPDVELVVVSANGDNELSLKNEVFCAAGTGDFAGVESYYDNLGDQLIDLINSNDIDYLSVSSCAAAIGYQESWPIVCLDESISIANAQRLASI